MSGGAGITQFETCVCGGMLSDEWESCKFCGASIGGDDDWAGDGEAPDQPRSVSQAAGGIPEPDLSSFDLHAEASTEAEDKTSNRLGLAGLVVVLIVAAVAGYLLLGGESSTEPVVTATPEQIIAPYAEFCGGGREPVDGAPSFKDDANGRTVYSSDFFSGSAPTGYAASAIVCADPVGEVVDGELCIGFADDVVFQQRVAFFRLTAYSAETGDVIDQIDAGPEAACPATLGGAVPVDGTVVGTASPDRSAHLRFVSMLENHERDGD